MAKTRKNLAAVLRLAAQRISERIVSPRGERVLLDADLAALYGVTTGALNRAVKRNRERFPEDFMFQLTTEEADSLRCQFGTLKTGRGRHRKFLPYAFTEQGVAMLSSVLRSRRAVLVNVEIMRAFVALRREAGRYAELACKLAGLERNQNFLGESPSPPRTGRGQGEVSMLGRTPFWFWRAGRAAPTGGNHELALPGRPQADRISRDRSRRIRHKRKNQTMNTRDPKHSTVSAASATR